ncbi:MAG: hypothetical protein AB4042_02205 [Leptolyngbyaceae cyanobacterium]
MILTRAGRTNLPMKFYFTTILRWRSPLLTPLFLLWLVGWGISCDPGLAQESSLPSHPSPILAPVELNWLNATEVVSDRPTITSTMISTSGLTPPSLWWIRQQVGGKLLKGWIAYPVTETQPAYVDLIVHRQLWNVSDYLERYRFVHHFGQAAQTFGYRVRVFNDVGEYLAVYPCVDMTATVAANQGPDPSDQSIRSRRRSCSVVLNSSGLGVLQDNHPLSNF